MTERTYPRKWFEADRWCVTPRAKTFDRETVTRLYWGKRFEMKRNSYSQWHPTLAEAQAAIDAHLAREAEAARKQRVRDAAEDLLEAAMRLVALEDEWGGRTFPSKDDIHFARKAIAKARGE